jgi:hypothetical protein
MSSNQDDQEQYQSGAPQGESYVGEDADEEAAPAEAALELESPVQWRIAKSLETLRAQINAMAPGRNKASDGGIGDPEHASRKSDHNPWVDLRNNRGVVTARDFTHDPKGGCDAGVLAEQIRAAKDPRVKYIIWNRQIASSSPIGSAPPWAWRPYTGKNPHNHHVHISVQPEGSKYDSEAPWAINKLTG